MYRIKKETIKTWILLVLIITSIIQVGILWDYQSHGFPTSFLTAFFDNLNNKSVDNPDVVRDKAFVPFRMVASNGEEAHWLLAREDQAFEELWEQAENYLSMSLDDKPHSIMPVNQWEELITKKSFVFEFKSELDIELLTWFLDKNKLESGEINGIHKVLMAPWDDINDDINTIYINGGNRIYKYKLKFDSSYGKKYYDKLLNRFAESIQYDTRQYKVIKEIDRGRVSLASVDPDILIALYPSPRVRNYRMINWSVPKEVSDLGHMAEIVLGSERTSFERSIDIYGTILFKTTDKIYRIFKDGLLEYKYIPGSRDGDRGNAGRAFLNAFRFISSIENKMPLNVDMYLSNMEKSGGAYKFTFDYMIDEQPVVLKLTSRGRNSEPVEHAAVITADSRRVLECRWMLKTFDPGSRLESYNVYLEDIESDTNLSRLDVNDIIISYVVESDEARNIGPSWVIERHTEDSIIVPVSRKEGN